MEKIVLEDLMSMNCYIITNENNECYIIDPGFNPNEINEYVTTKGYQTVGILLTHGHFDHISGINCFDVPVYVNENELELLDDSYLNGGFYYNIDTDKSKTYREIKFVKQGDKIPFGKETIDVYETPGHTRGSLSYKYKNDLFTGDTLFKGSVGKWDFPTGNQQTLKNTINKMFSSLDHELNVHPGHGMSTTIGREIKDNHFFNLWKKGEIFPSTVTTENDLFDEGRKLFDQRNFEKAKVIFDRIQELEPDNYFLSVYVNYCDKIIKGN